MFTEVTGCGSPILLKEIPFLSQKSFLDIFKKVFSPTTQMIPSVEVYLESSQTSTCSSFAKIINGFQPLTSSNEF